MLNKDKVKSVVKQIVVEFHVVKSIKGKKRNKEQRLDKKMEEYLVERLFNKIKLIRYVSLTNWQNCDKTQTTLEERYYRKAL